MATASDIPPVLVGDAFIGRWRSRSADADLDFFPFGRWGRGYRVSEAQVARLAQFTQRVLVISFVIGIGAVFALGAMYSGPARAHFTAYILVAVGLAAKLGFNVGAAWLLRRNPAAERPLTRVEVRESVGVTASLPRILVAIVIRTAMAATAIAVGAVVLSQGMADIDIEQRWLGVISSVILVLIGIYYAYRSVQIVQLHRVGRRPLSSR